jgi:site-specific DNA recombinase
MKVIIYARVSTNEQAKGMSLDHQLTKCRQQAELSEYQILEEIQDEGISAKNLKRPGMQQLLQRIEQIDAIVIYKLDRLTRSVKDLCDLIELLNRHNVRLVSISESLDTGSASGRMVITLLGTISQWERETIAERTRDVLRYKKSNGFVYSGQPPYGYLAVNGRLVPSQPEQQTIGLMKHLRESLMSWTRISMELNRLRIPARKGQWCWQSVQKIHNDNV